MCPQITVSLHSGRINIFNYVISQWGGGAWLTQTILLITICGCFIILCALFDLYIIIIIYLFIFFAVIK